MIIALAVCRTLMEKLDRDDLDQRHLLNRLDEVCELIEGDLHPT